MVPTVERGFFEVDFWSIDTAGESPSMKSTSGLSTCPRNMRAYEESDSTYRRCPSAKIVSKASEDFPDPDSPVKTTIASRGMVRSTFLRLFSRAPCTRILFRSLARGAAGTLVPGRGDIGYPSVTIEIIFYQPLSWSRGISIRAEEPVRNSYVRRYVQ